MNNGNVNHVSWDTISLLSLLQVVFLQVTNAAFGSIGASVSWNLKQIEPQMLFKSLKFWNLQMTNIIICESCLVMRRCQGNFCVQINGDAKNWDYMKESLQQWYSLTGFLPAHHATLPVVPISEIFSQTGFTNETTLLVCCLVYFAASLHKQSCSWYILKR